jgi:hypothetical protein
MCDATQIHRTPRRPGFLEVDDIRTDCGLPTIDVGRVMNRTWSLIQGWRGVGVDVAAICVTCNRVTTERNDLSFERHMQELLALQEDQQRE